MVWSSQNWLGSWSFFPLRYMYISPRRATRGNAVYLGTPRGSYLLKDIQLSWGRNPSHKLYKIIKRETRRRQHAKCVVKCLRTVVYYLLIRCCKIALYNKYMYFPLGNVVLTTNYCIVRVCYHGQKFCMDMLLLVPFSDYKKHIIVKWTYFCCVFKRYWKGRGNGWLNRKNCEGEQKRDFACKVDSFNTWTWQNIKAFFFLTEHYVWCLESMEVL